MSDPYALPDGKLHIAFSGGRTSGYMLKKIIDANGGCLDPERVKVIFTNTGREMPQTLDFVQAVSDHWGVEITWLEYEYNDGPKAKVVNRLTADETGIPFETLIRRRNYLPNQQERFCTLELKSLTARRHLVSLGWKKWTKALGIRADEPHRHKPKPQPREELWHPLVVAGVSKRDVIDFWRKQPFDLGLPVVNGRTVGGNCDGCFLKSEAELAALCRDAPERHEWWERMESIIPPIKGDALTFRKDVSRKSLRDFVQRQGDWIFDTEGVLCQKDGGECTG